MVSYWSLVFRMFATRKSLEKETQPLVESDIENPAIKKLTEPVSPCHPPTKPIIPNKEYWTIHKKKIMENFVDLTSEKEKFEMY